MQHFRGKTRDCAACLKKMQHMYWLTKYVKYTNFVVAVLVSYICAQGGHCVKVKDLGISVLWIGIWFFVLEDARIIETCRS